MNDERASKLFNQALERIVSVSEFLKRSAEDDHDLWAVGGLLEFLLNQQADDIPPEVFIEYYKERAVEASRYHESTPAAALDILYMAERDEIAPKDIKNLCLVAGTNLDDLFEEYKRKIFNPSERARVVEKTLDSLERRLRAAHNHLCMTRIKASVGDKFGMMYFLKYYNKYRPIDSRSRLERLYLEVQTLCYTSCDEDLTRVISMANFCQRKNMENFPFEENGLEEEMEREMFYALQAISAFNREANPYSKYKMARKLWEIGYREEDDLADKDSVLKMAMNFLRLEVDQFEGSISDAKGMIKSYSEWKSGHESFVYFFLLLFGHNPS